MDIVPDLEESIPQTFSENNYYMEVLLNTKDKLENHESKIMKEVYDYLVGIDDYLDSYQEDDE